MRHRTKSRRLGVKTQHRMAMLRNLSAALVEHGRIRTTQARAKALRPFVEKMVTRLKDPTLADYRLAHKTLGSRTTVSKIAKDISPAFKDRAGGYTRIMKLAKPRVGDAADMALVEWVDEGLVKHYQQRKASVEATKAKAAKKASKKKTTTKKADDAGEEKAAKKTAKKTAKKATKKTTKKD